eukprot:2972610-Amphidinium_carterae.1
MSGNDSITECLGGCIGMTEEMLAKNYETYCDPRLNYAQAYEPFCACQNGDSTNPDKVKRKLNQKMSSTLRQTVLRNAQGMTERVAQRKKRARNDREPVAQRRKTPKMRKGRQAESGNSHS